MKRRGLLAGAILSLLSSTVAQHAGTTAAAQTPPDQQLVGTWTLVSVDNLLSDGSRVHLYGPEPQGLLMFDAGGRYSLQIYRADRAKFASNDKSTGTPEENSAAVQGANAHFGRYAVDAAGHTITFRIEHASFPNWEGTQQQRAYAVTGDILTYTVPTPTSGGTATGEVQWKRAR
ncbi:MAG TPA: lipocalin-like domain-containing protein [Stellaceae bacterium]|nr:lipocalin-like domain-containing protein [Stellaceae bacterium]